MRSDMEEVRTVSQMNLYIKNMFVRDYSLQHVRVKGKSQIVNIIPRDIFILQ